MESLDLNQLSPSELNALAMYYYNTQPPYLLLGVGLAAALLSGLAFQTVLRELIIDWQARRSVQSLAKMRGWQLLTPFLGMAGGSIMFLAAGVETFGTPRIFAYAVSSVLTVVVGSLVWWQLGKILEQIEEGGSAALDLDNWG
jgi:hypothetical protein